MDNKIRELSRKRRRIALLKRYLSLVCVAVLLLTMNGLKQNANTLERIPMCGYAEEHVHSADCYVGDALSCDRAEHVHTDACYQQAPNGAASASGQDTEDLDVQPADDSVVEPDLGTLDAELSLGDEAFALVTEDVAPAQVVSNAVEDSPLAFTLGKGAMASQILEALELDIDLGEIVEVGVVENDETDSSLIGIEQVEDDYRIWANRDFDQAQLALTIPGNILVVALLDGVAATDEAESSEMAAQPTWDEPGQEMPAEEVAPEIADADIGVGAPAEVAAPVEKVVPVAVEQPAEEASATGKEKLVEGETNEEKQLAEEELPVAGEAEQPAEGEADEQPVEKGASGAEAPVEVSEQTGAGEQPSEKDGDTGAKGQPEEAGEGEEGVKATAEEQPVEESGEAGTGEQSVGEDGEAASEEEQSVEEGGEAASEEEQSVEEGGEAASEEEQSAEEGGEAASEEEQPAEEGEDASDAEVPAEGGEDTASGDQTEDDEGAVSEEQPVYSASIDLAEVNEYPLSLNALLAEITPMTDVKPVDETTKETPAESEEEAPAEASAWTIEYDRDLLSIEEAEGDHLVTPIASFESTRIDVYNGSRYALTLVNYALPEAGEAPEQPEGAYPAQTFEGRTEYMKVFVTAPEGAFPEGTTMSLADVEDAKTLTDIEDTVSGDFVEVKRVHAVDITFFDAEGNEIEPLAPIDVVMAVAELDKQQEAVVVHVDDAGETEVVESRNQAPAGETALVVEMPATDDPTQQPSDETAVDFEADSFSVYAVVVTETIETRYIDAAGETWKITVGYGPDAAIPAGATLAVAELPAQDYIDQAAEALEEPRRITEARFFDITILDEDGQAVQPAQPVTVNVALAVEAEGEVSALHFARDGVELLTAERDADATITFDAPGFSVYGIVYTVDFHFEIDGQVYETSLPGGGYLSFRALVRALGIAQDDPDTEIDEVQALVDEVERIELSTPDLLSISRVEWDTTVGALKQALGLDCEYSAELSEADVAEIDATEIKAVDWALVSLKPFDTEETLTVTLVGGEQFEIKVTDAQISTHVIAADGTDYLITVTYGPEAGIPDDAKLFAQELLPGSAEYEAHYRQACAQLGQGTADDADLSDEIAEARSILTWQGMELCEGMRMDIPFARFFDIRILVNDIEIEPLAPVQVSIEYSEPVEVRDGAQAEIVHFADSGIETIEPQTTSDGNAGISGFEFSLSSFSVNATLVKYTADILNGQYVIIKGSNSNFYALNGSGGTTWVYRNGDGKTYEGVPDGCVWNFTKQTDGNYIIQNTQYPYNRLVLYNGITGTWNQKIRVTPTGTNSTVAFQNPNNTSLRWDGNNSQFVSKDGETKQEAFYLARVNVNIPDGIGYPLKKASETDLGDLSAWKKKLTSGKILVDKTAEVYDYDNRIYKINLGATSNVTLIKPKVDIDLITDTSRSMYFPATLNAVANAYFTDINGLIGVTSWLDKSKVYYFIGEGQKATVFALYYGTSGNNANDYSNREGWRFVDASYLNPPDAASINEYDRLYRMGGTNIEDFVTKDRWLNIDQTRGSSLVGRLYTSPDDITRLAYLKEAVRIASEIVYEVDDEARIGLVTFNSSANLACNFVDKKGSAKLYNAIEKIGLEGGTRQDLGLQVGTQMMANARSDAQKVAVLITDGAPNMKESDGTQMDYGKAWGKVGEQATALKNGGTKLYTLGLSMDMVGGNNAANLASLASTDGDVNRHFKAEDGVSIANAIKDLIVTLTHDMELEANIVDVLDPAFYPVDQNGNPIQPGTYTDASGKTYTWEKLTENGVERWKVTYVAQNVGRGTLDASGNVTVPGWQHSFYVKARENFLGGNTIKTNNGDNTDYVEPIKCLYRDAQGKVTTVDKPDSLSRAVFPTPYVNVDELSLTQNDTQWTVYLGTGVDPMTQLKKLFDEIRVNEVVTRTVNGGHVVMTGADDTLYPVQKSNEDGRTVKSGAVPENFKLTEVLESLTDEEWTALWNKLISGQTVICPYSAYTHSGVGNIVISLTQKAVTGEDDLTPSPHEAAVVGRNVEQYTLTVKYVPTAEHDPDTGWHTTPGGSRGAVTNEMQSVNTHAIHVFAKSLKLRKMDAMLAHALTGAEFVLYRPAQGTETHADLRKIENANYVPATEVFTVDSDGIADIGAIKALESGDYYLVETRAPAGYLAAAPMKVTLTIADSKTCKPDANDPNCPYDWTQTASLTLGGVARRSDATWTATGEPASDSETATVYYWIPNNPGVSLPATGGSGTGPVYALGGMLLALALLGFASKKRARGADE